MKRFFIFCLFLTVHSNVFSQKFYLINKISVSGNRVTKSAVILRETGLHEGDSLWAHSYGYAIENVRQQIMNSRLFLEVNIESDTLDNIAEIKIGVTERWYIWPSAILEYADRNVNQWILNNLDLSRINYGAFFIHNNFLGLNQQLRIKFQRGYTEKYELKYSIPNLNKAKNINAGFETGFWRNKEVSHQTQSDQLRFFSFDNEYVYFKFLMGVNLEYRPGVRSKWRLDAGFMDQKIIDTLNRATPQVSFLIQSKNRQSDLIFKISYLRDFRDFVAYPLKGYFFESNLTLAPSLSSKGYFNTIIRQTYSFYQQINNNWYAAIGYIAEASLAKQQSYQQLRALGYYKDFVRGYENYVIDTRNFVVIKSNLKNKFFDRKYHLPNIGAYQFNHIPISMYLNTFLDAGITSNERVGAQNILPGKFIWGAGIGYDLVTYYDKILRLETTINSQKKFGFNIHFTFHI